MEITLRPYQLSDIDTFMEWACDPEVVRCSRLRHFTSKEDALNYLKEEAISHPWYRAICLDGLPIGIISLTPGSSYEKCRGMVSYALGSKYWGRGIMTKALRLVVSIAFKEFPDIERLEALIRVANKGSQRVVEKVGFVKEGVLRKYYVLDGATSDVVMYSLLSTDLIDN